MAASEWPEVHPPTHSALHHMRSKHNASKAGICKLQQRPH